MQDFQDYEEIFEVISEEICTQFSEKKIPWSTSNGNYEAVLKEIQWRLKKSSVNDLMKSLENIVKDSLEEFYYDISEWIFNDRLRDSWEKLLKET